MATVRTHPVERDAEEDGAPVRTGRVPVGGPIFGRMRRFIAGTGSAIRSLLSMASTIGMILMLIYELQFLTNFRLPWGWSAGGFGWIGALIMILIYGGSKMPHLLGQEPGDHWSLIREVLYGMVNFAVAVAFLTAVRWGLSASESAVSIFWALIAVFLGMIICEIIIAMRLTSRSWQNQVGGQGT